jgi:hypothetical protein
MHFSNCSWCCCPKSPIRAVHVPRLARTGYLVQYNVRWLFVCKTGAMHYRNLSQLLVIGYITYISIVIACTGTASGVGGTLAWLQGRRRFFEHGVCSFFFLPPPCSYFAFSRLLRYTQNTVYPGQVQAKQLVFVWSLVHTAHCDLQAVCSEACHSATQLQRCAFVRFQAVTCLPAPCFVFVLHSVALAHQLCCTSLAATCCCHAVARPSLRVRPTAAPHASCRGATCLCACAARPGTNPALALMAHPSSSAVSHTLCSFPLPS